MLKLNNRVIIISLTLLFLFIGAAAASTIDVGSGYTYTTVSSGMAAASSGDKVHVHAGTYVITSPIVMKSGVTLYGDGYNNTVISVTDKSKFASESAWAMITVTSCSNSEIYGLKFKGPASSVSDIHDSSQTYYGGHDDYHAAIRIASSSNIKVHDCASTMLLGDFVRTSTSGNSYLYIYNNYCYDSGHDCVQCWGVKNVYIYNNRFGIMINCGIRIANAASSATEIYQNTFTNVLSDSGWTCVQLQGSTTGVSIYKNVFTRTTDNYGVAGYDCTGSGSSVTNNVGYSMPSGFFSNLGDATKSNNTIYSTEYNWAAWGYGYNAASSSGGGETNTSTGGDTGGSTGGSTEYNGSVLPTLTSPSAGATVSPVNGKITLAWTTVGSSNYCAQIATDSGFTANAQTYTTTDGSVSISVSEGTTYYWRVRPYVDSTSTWGSYTSSRSFTTTQTVRSLTGVYGTIYDTSVDTPIKGAVVTMVNDTWSATAVTDEDGYYQFSVWSQTGTYYITASATDYITTPYQLPLNISNEYVERSIALTKSPSYFSPHYVKFIVTDNYLIHRYMNASISVYDSSNTLVAAKNTGADGAASFELDEDVRYKFVTSCTSGDSTDYITPSDDTYYIIVGSTDTTLLKSQFYDNITINVTKTEVNTSTATISANYVDNTSKTTNVQFILGQTETNGTFTAIKTSPVYSTTSTASYNFSVTDYLGKDYVVKIIVNHKSFGNVTKAFSVSFDGNSSHFANYKELAYLAIFILMIVGTQFGKQEHATGSILLCAIAWFFIIIGFFNPLGTAIKTTIIGGTVAATVYAVVSYFNSTRE